MDSQVLTDLTDIGDGDLTDWLTIGSKHHQASSKDWVDLTDWRLRLRTGRSYPMLEPRLGDIDIWLDFSL